MNSVYILVCLIGLASAVQIREFGTDKELHDAEHIKMHLEDKIAVDDVDLDADTQRFHYFTMHDLNKDYTIDGIELIKALTHSHEEHSRLMDDAEIEKMVDAVLNDLDADHDGLINYYEYSIKHQN